MFRSILTIFRELLNINKTYIKHGCLNALKYLHKTTVDIIKFLEIVQNWSARCGGCSFLAFYNGSLSE